MNKTTEALKLAEEALQHYRIKWAGEDTTPAHTRKALAAIREALAEPQINTPDVCGEACARSKLCYGCGKAFDEALAEPVKQEQRKTGGLVGWHLINETGKQNAE